MGRNIEIKARVLRPEEFRRRIAGIVPGAPKVLMQEDTFFDVPRGRLKLRTWDEGAELIHYHRDDREGPKGCDYVIARVAEPQAIRTALERACGIRAVVRKRRELYLAGQTRIHVDDVDGLGTFMELEVVLADTQSDAEGMAIVRGLMGKLGIAEADLVAGAYVDLLEE